MQKKRSCKNKGLKYSSAKSRRSCSSSKPRRSCSSSQSRRSCSSSKPRRSRPSLKPRRSHSSLKPLRRRTYKPLQNNYSLYFSDPLPAREVPVVVVPSTVTRTTTTQTQVPSGTQTGTQTNTKTGTQTGTQTGAHARRNASSYRPASTTGDPPSGNLARDMRDRGADAAEQRARAYSQRGRPAQHARSSQEQQQHIRNQPSEDIPHPSTQIE